VYQLIKVTSVKTKPREILTMRARRRDGAAQAGAEETLLRSTVHPDKPIQHSTKDAESNPTGNRSSSS